MLCVLFSLNYVMPPLVITLVNIHSKLFNVLFLPDQTTSMDISNKFTQQRDPTSAR